MTHEEKAEELFRSGMNCSQSVFCAFADELGMDRETAAKVSCGLGGGVLNRGDDVSANSRQTDDHDEHEISEQHRTNFDVESGGGNFF